MALRQVLPISDPRLREPSEAIDVSAGVPTAIKELARDLLETSKIADGAGMAAVQVGEPVRLFVMDLSKVGGHTVAFINPIVTFKSEETTCRKEGCLSMPGIFFEVERPAEIMIRYTDLDGAEQTYHAKDFAALCCQHEIDHLDGIRHIDHLSPLRRAMVLKQFEKAKKAHRLGARRSI